MIDEPEQNQLSVADYVGVARRRFKILAIAAALGLLVGLAYVLLSNPSYVSTARIELRRVTEGPFQETQANAAKVYAQTEREVVASEGVSEIAATKMDGGISPENIRGSLTVTPVPDSLAMEVEYASDSPKGAQQGAQAVAEAYLQYRKTSADDQVKALKAPFEARLKALQTAAKPLIAKLTAAGAAGGAADALKLQIEQNQNEQIMLNDKLSGLSAINTSPGQIVTPAPLPDSKAGLPPMYVLIGALALALTAGFVVAVVRDRTDPRLRSQGDLASLVGQTPISFIEVDATERTGDKDQWFGDWNAQSAARYAPGVGVAQQSSGAEAESYRRLALRLRTEDGRAIRFLLVTSAGEAMAEEVASNLALTIGREGKRALLIWSNLREDTLQSFFAVGPGPGLGEVLSGRVRLDEAILEIPGCQGLYLLPVGSREDARDHLFRLSLVKQALDDPQVNPFDMVILIAPSPNRYADALALAPQVDGVLVAVDTTDTNRNDLAAVIESLTSINAPIVGVVAL